jgi:acyl carrier protein
MDRQEITKLVIEAVSDYLESQDDDGASTEIEQNTMLFGDFSVLDSLGLVSVIVDIETQIRERGFDGITLTSDEVITRTQSPFRTVLTLVDFIDELIE